MDGHLELRRANLSDRSGSGPDPYALLKQMLLISAVETALLTLFSKGMLRGTVHTCLGQEGTAVGVVNALDTTKDIICSNHRGHGHYLAYTDDPHGLIAEIMGRPDGVCGGIGGSQHLQLRNFYSNGILGGMLPIAAGMAFAEKTRGNGAIVTIFFGDGALAEGAVHEAFNMASLWKLPVLFVVEDNGYAQSTPRHLEHAGALCDRAKPYGIPVHALDGNDVMAVHAVAATVADEIRNGAGPRLLHLSTYRLAPHSKGDDFRDPAEIEAAARIAPIPRLRSLLDAATCDHLAKETDLRIEAVLKSLKVL